MATPQRATMDSGTDSGIQLANLLVNASGTTEKTSTNPADWAVGNSQSVLSQALATSQNPQDALVSNILNQSAIKFAPTLAAGTGGSGLYNSSTLQLLQDNARGEAVGQSTAAVLQAQQAALQTAGNISNAQLNATKSTVTKTTPNIMDTLKAAVPGILIGAVGKKLGIDKVVGDTLDTLGSKLGFGSSAPSLGGDAVAQGVTASTDVTALNSATSADWAAAFPILDSAGNTVTAATTAAAGAAPTVADMAAGADTQVSQGLDMVGGNGSASLGLTPDAGTTTAVDATSGDAVGSQIASSDVATGDAVGDTIGSSVAADTTSTAIAADAVDTAASDSAGFELADVAAAASVICTELYRQGKMTPWEYSVELARAASLLSEEARVGYHYWGIPYTRLMRKSKLATAFIKPFAYAWAAKLRGEKTLLGSTLYLLGVPACEFIGRRILRKSTTEVLNHG